MSRHPFSSLFHTSGRPAEPDAELLRRYAAGDQSAFTALVERHGPRVWGVCRRGCRAEADAEDAFQAVFLLLAQKGGRLRATESVGSWLFGVAVRVARAAARRNRRRATQPLSDHPGRPPADPSDLFPIIDGELARLPDELRQVLLLCLIDGQSKASAAALLGLPEGTVASRLHRGRELLRQRLMRRGVSPTLPVFTPVPPPPVALAAADRVAAAVSAGALPHALRPVRRLASAGEPLMSLRLFAVSAVALLIVGVVAVWAARSPADPPKAETNPPSSQSGKVEVVWEGSGVRDVRATAWRYVVLSSQTTGLTLLDARTGKPVAVPDQEKGTTAAFAPDLKSLWVGTTDGDVVRYSFPELKELKRWRVKKPMGKGEWGGSIAGIELSADGRRAAWWCDSGYQPGGVVDVGEDKPLATWKEVGDTSSSCVRKRVQFTADGKRVIFTSRHKEVVGKHEGTSNDVFAVWDLAAGKPTALVEAYLAHDAADNLLRDDVLFHAYRSDSFNWELRKYDLATAKTSALGPLRLGHWINLLPSPSGEYIAEWTPTHQDAQIHSTKTGKVVGTLAKDSTTPVGWVGGKRELVLVRQWERGGLDAVDPLTGKAVVTFDGYAKRAVLAAESFDDHTRLVVIDQTHGPKPEYRCRVLTIPDGLIPPK